MFLHKGSNHLKSVHDVMTDYAQPTITPLSLHPASRTTNQNAARQLTSIFLLSANVSTDNSAHHLSKFMQGTYRTLNGGMDYDQQWITVLYVHNKYICTLIRMAFTVNTSLHLQVRAAHDPEASRGHRSTEATCESGKNESRNSLRYSRRRSNKTGTTTPQTQPQTGPVRLLPKS